MSQSTQDIGRQYYEAMGNRDIETVSKYLHEHVTFSGPLANTQGKDIVLGAVKGFMAFFQDLTIRHVFGDKDQVMVVYDMNFPAPIGLFRGAALLKVQDGLITSVELFYDARPFENAQGQIFTRQ